MTILDGRERGEYLNNLARVLYKHAEVVPEEMNGRVAKVEWSVVFIFWVGELDIVYDDGVVVGGLWGLRLYRHGE